MPISYQWYDNTSGPYLPVVGGTGSAYTFTPTTSGVYGVYLSVTDSSSISVASATSFVTAVFSVSIGPASAMLNVTSGESQLFSSTVSDATSPSYQWYDNTTGSYLPVVGGTGSAYTFTPTASETYGVYLVVTDSSSISVQSAVSIVNTVFSVSIGPASAMLNVTSGESQLFSSTVWNGLLPFSYQWYDNTSGPYLPVVGGTGSAYTFTPATSGIYGVYLNVTDSSLVWVKSATSFVTAVFSVSIGPASATLNVTSGESQLFSSTVTSATLPISYQWYDNATGVYLPVVGETASAYTFTPATSGIYGVYLSVTDSSSISAPSSTSFVTAVFSVSIAPASAMLNVTSGESQLFSSTVTSATLPFSYQWYDNTTGSYLPVVGGTGSAYTFTPTASETYGVYLVVTDSSSISVQSAVSIVNTVFSVSIAPASAMLNVTSGESQLFSSTVWNGLLPFSYQWYDNTSGPYLPVVGETGSAYTFTPATSGIYGVYLNVTDSSLVWVKSATSFVTAVFSVSIGPASATLNVTSGESQLFSSTVTSATLPISYQWYDNTSGPYLPVVGETGSAYTFTPTTSGVYGVYVVVTDSSLVWVKSATSFVTAVFSVSIGPASATLNVTSGESQLFSSTVTSATLPISYQWYDNTSGPYLPVMGETGSAYTFTPTTSGVYGVYVVVTDSSLVWVKSATSFVTAVFSVSIGPASATLNVTSGESQLFSSTVSDATSPSYQWYDNTSGSFLPVMGETGSAYTFTPTASETYGVYLVVTDSSSISVQSAVSIVNTVL